MGQMVNWGMDDAVFLADYYCCASRAPGEAALANFDRYFNTASEYDKKALFLAQYQLELNGFEDYARILRALHGRVSTGRHVARELAKRSSSGERIPSDIARMHDGKDLLAWLGIKIDTLKLVPRAGTPSVAGDYQRQLLDIFDNIINGFQNMRRDHEKHVPRYNRLKHGRSVFSCQDEFGRSNMKLPADVQRRRYEYVLFITEKKDGSIGSERMLANSQAFVATTWNVVSGYTIARELIYWFVSHFYRDVSIGLTAVRNDERDQEAEFRAKCAARGFEIRAAEDN